MKWQSAHLGNDPASVQLYQRIVPEFERIFQATNEPKGMALFQANDSFGTVFAVYVSPAAVPYCESLFEIAQPWQESDPMPGEVNVSLVAGDKEFIG